MSVYPDFHTHRLSPPYGPVVINLPSPAPDASFRPVPDARYSAGWHPWHLPTDFESARPRLEALLQEPQVVAVGECGPDRSCSTPLERQLRAFRLQIELSEKYGLPLTLHVVHAFDLVLGLRKLYAPHMEWTVHGFRGKASTAAQLLKAGMNLSFGPHFREESVVCCPVDRMFIETDEADPSCLPSLYARIAALKGIPPEALARDVASRLPRRRV